MVHGSARATAAAVVAARALSTQTASFLYVSARADRLPDDASSSNSKKQYRELPLLSELSSSMHTSLMDNHKKIPKDQTMYNKT